MNGLVKNLKIRTKLLLMLGIALVAMVVIGIIGFVMMTSLNNAMSVITSNWLPAIDISREIDTRLSDLRLHELEVMVNTDPNTPTLASSTRSTLEADASEIIALFAEYEAMIYNEEERKLYEAALESWNTYHSAQPKFIAYLDSGDMAATYNSFFGNGVAYYEDVSDKVLAINTFNVNGSNDATAQSESTYKRGMAIMIIIMLIIIVVCVIIGWVLVGAIRKPVAEIEAAAKQMAAGHFDIKIDYESKDELGTLANAMREVVRKLDAIVGDETQFLGKMAKGDFIVDSICEHEYIGDFHPVLIAFRGIADRMNDAMMQITDAAAQVDAGAEQVSSGAQALSQGATEQASSVEELAATINDVSAHVVSTAKNAESANDIAQQVGIEIQQSNQHMEEMIAAMNAISDASEQIGKIIKTIEDISFQTNILALNAAVEAARAGSAGKGFAVVADEVRNLATKSGEAAQETTAMIEHAIDAVKNGNRIADTTAEAMRSVVSSAEKVVDLVGLISDASKEQADSISQITEGIDQISSVVQTNSATAEQSAAASEELSGQAGLLNNLMATFQIRGRENMAMLSGPAMALASSSSASSSSWHSDSDYSDSYSSSSMDKY